MQNWKLWSCKSQQIWKQIRNQNPKKQINSARKEAKHHDNQKTTPAHKEASFSGADPTPTRTTTTRSGYITKPPQPQWGRWRNQQQPNTNRHHHRKKMVPVEPEPHTEETSAGEKFCHWKTHPPRKNRHRTGQEVVSRFQGTRSHHQKPVATSWKNRFGWKGKRAAADLESWRIYHML
jgi:hypothetical protein